MVHNDLLNENIANILRKFTVLIGSGSETIWKVGIESGSVLNW